MERIQILAELRQLAEISYKEFNLKIIPTQLDVLGVRMPALRSLAKKIAKEDWRSFLEEAESNIYEEVMLQGLVTAYAKMDWQERLAAIAAFVPKIENWGLCDSFCGTLKVVRKHQEEFFAFLQPYLASEKEFFQRFAVVMLMEYYLDERYLDRVLKIYDGIASDCYYVQMAVAWGISVAFVKFPEKTLAFLKDNHLNSQTHQKALQKILESRRVDSETKKQIKMMKRNR